MLDTGAAPAVYRLVIIADGERNAARAGKQPKPGVLDRVGVLELVDQQVPEAPPIVREQLGIVAPQLVGAQQELCKIDQPAAVAKLLVAPVERDELPAIRVPLVVQVLGPQALVLLPVDEVLYFPRYPACFIEFEVPEQPLDQPQLVV